MLLSMLASTSRACELSSMIRTCRPRRSGRGILFTTMSLFPKRAVNQNVLPLPNSLSTPTSPPINFASCFEIASPSPVPPYCRVVVVSACSNAWNSLPICSSVKPMPVSLTEKWTSFPPSSSSCTRARTTISPFSVNFTALLQKLIRICPTVVDRLSDDSRWRVRYRRSAPDPSQTPSPRSGRSHSPAPFRNRNRCIPPIACPLQSWRSPGCR